jgi:hypothetical protein
MYSATDQPVADEYRPAKRQGSGDEEQTYETADHPGDVSSRPRAGLSRRPRITRTSPPIPALEKM